jgi:tetratricopeptide (TPR) repeat protein
MPFLIRALAAGILGASLTTWVPKDFNCPDCSVKNTFRVIASYGGYIYRWPSKFQYIFWPLTDPNVVYSCKQCKLTCFMWDYEKFPKEKMEEVRKKLQGIEIEEKGDYAKIPMSQRLAAAERVYEVLGRDDEFWCRFHRVKGYHFEAEKKAEEAKAARKKALELGLKLLEKKENAGRKKELLLVTGSMRYFTGEAEAAMKDLEEALKLKFEADDPKKSENMDEYFSGVLREFIDALKEGRRPGEEGEK